MERLCGEFENLREAKAASRRLEGRQGGKVGLGLDPGYDGARQWVFLEGGEKHFTESFSMKTVKTSAQERVGNCSDLCIPHRVPGAGPAT